MGHFVRNGWEAAGLIYGIGELNDDVTIDLSQRLLYHPSLSQAHRYQFYVETNIRRL